MFDWSGSIPPLRDQPVALILWHAELLDRLLDRALLTRSVIDDADQLSRRAAVPIQEWFRSLERPVL
jgi:hypothetical protein